jgi:hypothetical protein
MNARNYLLTDVLPGLFQRAAKPTSSGNPHQRQSLRSIVPWSDSSDNESIECQMDRVRMVCSSSL